MRIAELVAAALLSSASAAAPPVASGVLQSIDTFIETERARSRIPGIALALVQDGRVIAVRGYGTCGDGRPMTGDVPMPIGSLTKSFTAVLVRQLADAGRVDVDAPVQRYLPWFTLADATAARRVTVRHLLNQTSGLSRADGMRAILTAGDADIDTLARSVTTLTPTAAPGERFQYSNLNFILLGAVAQAVERIPWPELLQQRIFEPLEMRHSYATPTGVVAMSAVHRYLFGVPVGSELSFAPGLAPAGALIASAEDMARYVNMLLQHGQGPRGVILSAAAVASMLSAAAPPSASRLLGTEFRFRYGEGWFVGPFGAWSDARWHLGNLASFAAWMVVRPEGHEGVIVLINANSELPLFDANATFSRIPIGIVNLLSNQAPPSGSSVQAAYVKVGLVLAVATVVLGGSCVVALRRRHAWPTVALALLALVVALAVSIRGSGWLGWFSFAPDLAAWLVLMLLVPPAAVVWRYIKASRR